MTSKRLVKPLVLFDNNFLILHSQCILLRLLRAYIIIKRANNSYDLSLPLYSYLINKIRSIEWAIKLSVLRYCSIAILRYWEIEIEQITRLGKYNHLFIFNDWYFTRLTFIENYLCLCGGIFFKEKCFQSFYCTFRCYI